MEEHLLISGMSYLMLSKATERFCHATISAHHQQASHGIFPIMFKLIQGVLITSGSALRSPGQGLFPCLQCVVYECRKAYLRKIAAAHPDKGGTSEQFQQISAAYETLQGRELNCRKEDIKIHARINENYSMQNKEYFHLHSEIAASAFCQAMDRYDNGKLTDRHLRQRELP